MKRPLLLSLPIVLLLAACNEQPLLHNLSEQQANEVVAVLQAHDVSVQKEDQGKAGFAVAVGKTDFPAAVDLLQQFDLPSRARVEIAQSFPADAMVASPQAEQARLLSAIEQRLEQNLAAMKNVVSARVELSYPMQQSMSSKSEPPMHASILLTYRNDINADMLVSEVKRFVKNSFTNIDYDNISVILSRAPSVFRNTPTQPAAGARTSGLYWLLAIPAVIAAAAAGLLMFLRWRPRSRDGRPTDAPPADQLERGAQDLAEPNLLPGTEPKPDEGQPA
ncbi:type III secretion system protein [Burkholderia ubonensis]|uniref:type III secretion system inner membrane ring lipoprotein SctJ n=1 Tax=Burkholderia ubonensis TaxID=101571 RepID=UPI00075CB9DE|nr:type III secretion inner membrane ring lipoprotein SctJ [Burkholderia ubonensis]KVM73938.1 type III secretion system protein [Burkholderia ubonensis]